MSREGDFWRWDGFAVAAHAPTGAARRLAERGRLQSIEGELATARSEVEARQRVVEAAEAALATAAAAETEARARWREAQHRTDSAREEHAAAEREISRNAARISALKEAKQRTSAGCDEAAAARDEAEKALAALPAAADLEAKLAQVNDDIAKDRAALAEVRVEAQAIARDAELPIAGCRRSPASARLGMSARTMRPRKSSRSDSATEEARSERSGLDARAGEIRRPASGPDRRDRDGNGCAPRGRRPAGGGRDRARRSRQGGAGGTRSRRRSPRRSSAGRGTPRRRQPPPRRHRT